MIRIGGLARSATSRHLGHRGELDTRGLGNLGRTGVLKVRDERGGDTHHRAESKARKVRELPERTRGSWFKPSHGGREDAITGFWESEWVGLNDDGGAIVSVAGERRERCRERRGRCKADMGRASLDRRRRGADGDGRGALEDGAGADGAGRSETSAED